MVTFAQEGPRTSSDVAGIKTSFKSNNTWDNWFIQLGGGAQTVLDDPGKSLFNQFGNIDLDKVAFPALNLSIGRWWAPYWGFRIKGQDMGILEKELFDGLEGIPSTNMYEKINIHVDAMWNMSQYFGKYRANRVFNFIPYAGLGWVDSKNFDNGRMSINFGLLFEFRLSNHFGLHLDLAGAKIPQNVLAATAGFTFNLGKTYFEVVEPMDHALVNDLNSKINALRNENAELSKRPIKCETCVTCPTVDKPDDVNSSLVAFENIVLFRISSAVIDANQRIQIFNTAEFLKNTNEKVVVIGFADRQTGSAAYNLRLSERRARAVAQELISRYGISSDRIIVEWRGDKEQPFKENDWNRVVIMRAK
ncbi:MAG: OmpA family protein [Dysgonamonadaceae bacterium]|nr:OmpA family protein [Dysgonamonadaceae bacterium]